MEKHQFASIHIIDTSGDPTPFGVTNSESVWSYLKENCYIDHKGKVQDKLRTALKDGSLSFLMSSKIKNCRLKKSYVS